MSINRELSKHRSASRAAHRSGHNDRGSQHGAFVPTFALETTVEFMQAKKTPPHAVSTRRHTSKHLYKQLQLLHSAHDTTKTKIDVMWSHLGLLCWDRNTTFRSCSAGQGKARRGDEMLYHHITPQHRHRRLALHRSQSFQGHRPSEWHKPWFLGTSEGLGEPCSLGTSERNRPLEQHRPCCLCTWVCRHKVQDLVH